ncbi:YgdI/YgdR family lipoprotein [Flavobacterium piscisymbiosum]|uniref:YgdI/YgdR family lipoprotein n=1 Tax=Flavobacterium piscisymbiosum TaxID=2893753 RepID=A0ABS8M869_9FLAO|nr:YgdI/YgdR family lipoprotein [Flavobacterium sp. F-30]MCC9061660.1 YgdI/YgdR family lipoprotein [Flavobacterium sp. F-30]
MIKRSFLTLIFLLLCCKMNAQELISPSYGFSHSKTAYITLADGTEINGTIKDIDRDKGLIEYIKLQDGTGKKHKLKPKDIKFMYLPPSGLDNLGKKMSFASNFKKWNDQKLNEDFLNQGYAYFETADVKVKKKDSKLLMQLLNPTFSKEFKVYCDPYAKQTTSLGVGGVKFLGGDLKSYYVAKKDSPAFLLKKKDYKKEFVPLWGSCDKVISEYKEIIWTDLVKHIITYSECVDPS